MEWCGHLRPVENQTEGDFQKCKYLREVRNKRQNSKSLDSGIRYVLEFDLWPHYFFSFIWKTGQMRSYSSGCEKVRTHIHLLNYGTLYMYYLVWSSVLRRLFHFTDEVKMLNFQVHAYLEAEPRFYVKITKLVFFCTTLSWRIVKHTFLLNQRFFKFLNTVIANKRL